MSDTPTTSKGKIARLSAQLREAVNRRLHDGVLAADICAWLNAMPEVQTMLAVQFEGEPIQPQNISNWRMGGFQRWLAEQQRVQRTRDRALYSLELAKASGGNLAEGALAQLTGEVLEMVEEIADLREAGQEINPDLIQAVNKSLVAARAKELETQALALKERQADLSAKDLALREAKFQRDTAELFIKFYADTKAKEIMESKSDKTVKMDSLVQLIFGQRPPTKEAA